jgi:hypothetical protein
MSSSSDSKMQNLLDAITVALQHDDDIEPIINTSGVAHEDVNGFVSVIQSLNTTFTPVEPSSKFADNLQAELMGTRPSRVVSTVRHLPARVHVAALVAVIAGFGLFVLRRLMGDATPQDIADEPLAV